MRGIYMGEDHSLIALFNPEARATSVLVLLFHTSQIAPRSVNPRLVLCKAPIRKALPHILIRGRRA